MKRKNKKFISLSLDYIKSIKFSHIALAALSVFFLIGMRVDIVKELSFQFDTIKSQAHQSKSNNLVASIGPPQTMIHCTFESDLCVFSNGSDDDFEWLTNSGSTATSHTGPVGAFTGSNYLYVESSYPNTPEKIAILESEEIDASYLEMGFAYHMYGASVGDLSVQVSSNGGSWEKVFSENGNKGAQWNYKTIDLTSYTGRIRIRIVAFTSDDLYQGYEGDIAIDEIFIKTNISLEPLEDNDTDGIPNSRDLWPYDPNDGGSILNPDSDFDGDSIPNDKDNDIDGDGVDNVSDLWPYDPGVTKWKLDISSDTYLKTLYGENITDAQGSDIININNIEVAGSLSAQSISVIKSVLLKKSNGSTLLPKISAGKYTIKDLAEKFVQLDNFSIQYFDKENKSSGECKRRTKNGEMTGCSEKSIDENISDKIFVKVSDDISINVELDPITAGGWIPTNFIVSSPDENLNLLGGAGNADVVIQGNKLRLASNDSTFCIDNDCLNRDDFTKIAWIGSSEYLRQKPSFVNIGSGVVKEIQSGLLWYDGTLGNGNYEDLIERCSKLNVGGYSWHLPDSDELISIFDYNKILASGDSAYDTSIFTSWPISGNIRTSTEDAKIESKAISFGLNGEILKVNKSKIINEYGICVSSDLSLKNIPWNGSKFNFNSDVHGKNCELEATLRFKEKFGQIKDICTGLIWEKSSNYGYLNWDDAKLYCEDLVLGGYGSWRLPNVKELYSIINKGKTQEEGNDYRPFFDEIKGLGKFWTGTKSPNYINSHHWQIYLSGGEVVANPDDYSDHHVRCVR